MFTLKHKKLLILLASCSLLLSACYPSGGEALSTENNSVINQQIEYIASNNEHLEINVPPAENISEVPKINVKIMEWDEDKLKNIFLAGKENLEHQETDSYTFTNEKRHLYIEGDAEGDKYWLGYEPGELSSLNCRSNGLGYGTLEANISYGRFEDIFTDDAISLLSKEDAIKRCTDILKEIGITNYSEPTVYAITADKANKFLKNQYDEYEEYKDWSSPDDEVYVMRFPVEYNGISVTTVCPSGTDHGHDTRFVGSYIDFIVTKDTVFSLEAWNIFLPEYEMGDSVKINCSSENAMKIAAEYYDSLSLGNMKYKIFDRKLVYVTYEKQNEKNFTLYPMWEIETAYYRDDDIIGTRESLFIDAQTGNIIIW